MVDVVNGHTSMGEGSERGTHASRYVGRLLSDDVYVYMSFELDSSKSLHELLPAVKAVRGEPGWGEETWRAPLGEYRGVGVDREPAKSISVAQWWVR